MWTIRDNFFILAYVTFGPLISHIESGNTTPAGSQATSSLPSFHPALSVWIEYKYTIISHIFPKFLFVHCITQFITSAMSFLKSFIW